MALGHGDETALAYLHEVFEIEPDRRQDVAQAVATFAAQQVPARRRLAAAGPLAAGGRRLRRPATCCGPCPSFRRQNDKPQDLRQVILLGLKLGDQGGREAAQTVGPLDRRASRPSRAGRGRRRWPPGRNGSSRNIPISPSRCCRRALGQPLHVRPVDRLSRQRRRRRRAAWIADAVVFEKAQCVKCHRYGTRGEGIGPDLSNVSSRFQRKEILESVIFPSQVISDQFAAKTVLTNDGRRTPGSSARPATAWSCCKPTPRRSTSPRPTSTRSCPAASRPCPRDCSTTLTLAEIADLFAYLASRRPPSEARSASKYRHVPCH